MKGGRLTFNAHIIETGTHSYRFAPPKPTAPTTTPAEPANSSRVRPFGASAQAGLAVGLACWWMFGKHRRLTTAAVMAAMLIGVMVHGSGSGVDLDWQTGHQQDSVLAAATSPVAVTSAVRSRTGFDNDFGSVRTALAGRFGGLVVILVWGLGAVAAVWWYLLRPDRQSAGPLRRSLQPALRGPPAPVDV